MYLQERDQHEAVVPWFVLDARKSVEELHSEIASIADEVIARSEGTSVKKLWL